MSLLDSVAKPTMFKLLERAVTALEQIAENTTRIAAATERNTE
mgnify:CR=1 FL=1